MPPNPRVGRAKDADAVTLAVYRPAEAWHLARFANLKAVTREVEAALAESEVVDAQAQRLMRRLRAESAACWKAFVECKAESSMEVDALARRGEPEDVYLDEEEELVVVAWREVESVGDWDVIRTSAEDGTDQPFVLNTPFRMVRTRKFPEGTRFIQINDPRHAATAALEDVFTTIVRDVIAFSEGIDPYQAWIRMRHQTRFYHSTIRIVSRGLKADEFHQWNAALPKAIPIDIAHEVIASTGASVRSQRTLALLAAAREYTDTMNRLEKAGQGDEVQWSRKVLEHLEAMRNQFRDALTGYTNVLLAFAGISPSDRVQAMTIVNPFPAALPMLAVLPAGSPPVASIEAQS